ncbi:PREDICTED: uncharacterized protein LOC102006414 [Chinchilla lanigera]|uniref:uncharacterized protein LOC102006414 n=1 Tax=Chinchilla lanigera TaxID=34839 RepID=UPI000698372C|nr:PREDICTED: uncharacterized protein LOC102006414 [Chinchilla lanigera]
MGRTQPTGPLPQGARGPQRRSGETVDVGDPARPTGLPAASGVHSRPCGVNLGTPGFPLTRRAASSLLAARGPAPGEGAGQRGRSRDRTAWRPPPCNAQSTALLAWFGHMAGTNSKGLEPGVQIRGPPLPARVNLETQFPSELPLLPSHSISVSVTSEGFLQTRTVLRPQPQEGPAVSPLPAALHAVSTTKEGSGQALSQVGFSFIPR